MAKTSVKCQHNIYSVQEWFEQYVHGYWQTVNVNILSQCNLLRAPCSTPCVSRGQLSLSGTQLRARAVLTLCWDLAARTSNSSIPTLRPDCTPAREGENFPKTFLSQFSRFFFYSANCFADPFNRRNWLRSINIEHVCACIALDYRADLLLFFLRKKSRKEERKVLTTSLFLVTFLRFLFVTHCRIVSLVVLFRGPVFIAQENPVREIRAAKRS